MSVIKVGIISCKIYVYQELEQFVYNKLLVIGFKKSLQ